MLHVTVDCCLVRCSNALTPVSCCGLAMLLCSSSCFGGQTCGDAILTPVMNFVNRNFADKDWHKREAAILAFGKWDNSGGAGTCSACIFS